MSASRSVNQHAAGARRGGPEALLVRARPVRLVARRARAPARARARSRARRRRRPATSSARYMRAQGTRVSCAAMSLPDWPGVEHRYHELSTGVRAHVAHAGPEDAPPLVALHGFPQHWYEWRRVIDALPASSACWRWTRAGSAGRAPPPTATTARRGSPRTRSRCSTTSGSSARCCSATTGAAGPASSPSATAPERWIGLRRDRRPAPVAAAARAAAHAPADALPAADRRAVRSARGSSRGSCRTFLRVGWGDRSTYDEAAEEIYAATYREPARAEAAQPLLPPLPGARGAARPRRPPDRPDEAALRHARAARPRRRRGLRALRRRASCSRAAATSCPRSAREGRRGRAIYSLA